MKRFIAHIRVYFLAVVLCLLLVQCAPQSGVEGGADGVPGEKTSTTFAMSTIVTQTAWGDGAERALKEVNEAFVAYEERLSLFGGEGDIARLNRDAGQWVDISPKTAALLQKSIALSESSEGTFAVTIAPLTRAWGITTDTPRIPPQSEIDELLPLVDDGALLLEEGRAMLPREGMGVDLGGIAKGAACSLAEEIYEKNGVESALLDIGGNVYARGTKPGGDPWVVGFRDPAGGYIASLPLEDEVIAVSGGYERYFEEDGKRYIHILDPRTGYPAESDIVSVGVIDGDGAVADFYSTTLFIEGLEAALNYMRDGGTAIVLDEEGNLYVSRVLEEGFRLREETQGAYELIYIDAEAP